MVRKTTKKQTVQTAQELMNDLCKGFPCEMCYFFVPEIIDVECNEPSKCKQKGEFTNYDQCGCTSFEPLEEHSHRFYHVLMWKRLERIELDLGLE